MHERDERDVENKVTGVGDGGGPRQLGRMRQKRKKTRFVGSLMLGDVFVLQHYRFVWI